MNEDVTDIAVALAAGEFSVKSRLRQLILAAPEDVGSGAMRLWALVSSHADVELLDELLDQLSSPEGIRRAVVALGLTLSPAAIPILWKYHDVCDDSDLDEYIGMALGNVVLPRVSSEARLGEGPLSRDAVDAVLADLNPRLYYYEGESVFPGVMTKELVNAAVVARHQGSELACIYEIELLEAFSGVSSPVQSGETVDDASLHAVFEFVKAIAVRKWTQGMKYFHGHPIVV